MLNAILDHVLQLLPDEPAQSKRLDDIVDADASASDADAQETVIPGSGIRANSGAPAKGASKMRAAS
jgi:hypothetical protein